MKFMLENEQYDLFNRHIMPLIKESDVESHNVFNSIKSENKLKEAVK